MRSARLARREEVLALGAIVLVLLAEATLLTVSLDELDEGYFAEQGRRVLHGALPYRDFDTLYTPGWVYLTAGVFAALDGPHIIGLRVLSFISRVLLALSLYGLTRLLVRPWFAALPALFLLIGLDQSPTNWYPHPGWLSASWSVCAAWMLAHLPTSTGRRRQLVLLGTGVCVALAFLFKQNAGVYIGLAAAGFVLLRGVRPAQVAVTPLTWAVQALAVATVLGAVVWLVAPYMDGWVLALLVGPLVALGGVLLFGPVRTGAEGLGQRAAPMALLGTGFLVATLPWATWLLLMLAGHLHRVSLFGGTVDLSALHAAFTTPGPAMWPVLGITVSAVLAVHASGTRRVALLALGGVFVALIVPLTALPDEPAPASLFLAPRRAGDGLTTLLVGACVWAGVWLARHRAERVTDWRTGWLAVAAAFTFLTQYPRMDEVHFLWSAGIPLAMGAVALERLHRALAVRWRLGATGRAALFAALLVVPVFAALPGIYQRAWILVQLDQETGWPEQVPLTRLTDLAYVVGLRVPADQAYDLLRVVQHVRATTTHDEPIFVYPTAPLLYIVTERSNPTRYNHLYPGAAPVAELKQVVEALEATPVRTVVVSEVWRTIWRQLGENQPLDRYLDTAFQQTARAGPYLVLTRVVPPEAPAVSAGVSGSISPRQRPRETKQVRSASDVDR